MTTRTDEKSLWFLDRGLTGCAVALILVQLAFWVPHYLAWPYWADHDVFANAARSWFDGRLPYRDTRLNNFPGTIYLFALTGTLCGWGRPGGFFALDVGLLLTYGGTLAFWSRRNFGRTWPGLLGFLAYLSLAMGLDYAHAAQRDWQAPALVVLALLVVQTSQGTAALVGSAGLAACGFAIRPQVVLLGPALAWSAGWLDPSLGRAAPWRRVLVWAGALAGFVLLLFWPLVRAGVWDDFVGSLRLVRPGSAYNRVSGLSILKRWCEQAAELRWIALGLGLLVMVAARPDGPRRRLGWAWLLALAGVSFYQPLSPVAHSYLDIPLPVVGAGALAVILGCLAAPAAGPASLRLVAVLGLVAMGGTTLRPFFVQVGPTVRAIRGLWSGAQPDGVPPGYFHGSVGTSAFYPWADYRATLDYLNDQTKPTTRVANLLKGDPAVVSMVDRGSALPAESITWLRMVRPDDQPLFADQLVGNVDSVVVWDPGSDGADRSAGLSELAAVVRRYYQPAVRFGVIEVWQRKRPPF